MAKPQPTNRKQPLRRQPRRATRDDVTTKKNTPTSSDTNIEEQHHASSGEGAVANSRVKKRLPKQKKARAKVLERQLLKRVDAMDQEAAWLEQRRLLGLDTEDTASGHTTSSTAIAAATPSIETNSQERRGGGAVGRGIPSDGAAGCRRKPSISQIALDRIMTGGEASIFNAPGSTFPDQVVEEPEEEEQDLEDPLRRSDRWIPDMAVRPRLSGRPRSVPQPLWLAYCLLDDYVYRRSLTEEQVASLPFMDEVDG